MAEKQNIYYILAVIVIIIVVAAIAMKLGKEPAQAPAPVIPGPTAPTLPEAEVPTTYEGDAEMVTQAVCADGKVGAVITNVASETLTVGTEIKFLLRGMVVKEPGCDKTEVAPGESTTCTTMNGNFAVSSGKNEVVVRIAGAKEGLATVTCG